MRWRDLASTGLSVSLAGLSGRSCALTAIGKQLRDPRAESRGRDRSLAADNGLDPLDHVGGGDGGDLPVLPMRSRVAVDDGLDVGDSAPPFGPLGFDETPLHRLERPVAISGRQTLQPLQRHHVGGRIVALADDAERLARRRPRLGQTEPADMGRASAWSGLPSCR